VRPYWYRRASSLDAGKQRRQRKGAARDAAASLLNGGRPMFMQPHYELPDTLPRCHIATSVIGVHLVPQRAVVLPGSDARPGARVRGCACGVLVRGRARQGRRSF
jgi:hypothetical protein